MANPSNNGTLIGRAASDPKVFVNQDGSKKVLLTVYVDRDYKSASGQRDSDALPVEAYVRKETKGTGPFENVHKGDLIAVSTSLRLDHFTKQGAEVFEVKVIADGVRYLESRAVTQARLAARATEQNAAPVAAAPAVETAVDSELVPF